MLQPDPHFGCYGLSALVPETTEGYIIPSMPLRCHCVRSHAIMAHIYTITNQDSQYIGLVAMCTRLSGACRSVLGTLPFFWQVPMTCMVLPESNRLNLVKVMSILFRGQSPFFANLRAHEKVSSCMIGGLSFCQQAGHMFARGTKVWPSTLGRFVLFVRIFVSLVKKTSSMQCWLLSQLGFRLTPFGFAENTRKYHDVGFWPFMFHVQNVCQIFHRIPNPPGRPVVVLGGHFNPNQTFPDVSGKAFHSEGKRNKDEVRPAMLDARQFKNGVLRGTFHKRLFTLGLHEISPLNGDRGLKSSVATINDWLVSPKEVWCKFAIQLNNSFLLMHWFPTSPPTIASLRFGNILIHRIVRQGEERNVTMLVLG